MARRKTRKRRARRTTTTTRARKRTYRRRNPANPRKKSTRRSYARAAGRRLMTGISIKQAFKDQIPIQFGMLAAKFMGKKLGGPAAEDLDPNSWNYISYAKMAAGALAAGLLANLIKPGTGQKAFTGGMSLVFHKVIRNELISQSTWAQQHFGEDDDMYIDDGGTPYVEVGGRLVPASEDYRMAGTLVRPNQLGQLVAVNELGQLGSVETQNDFSKYVRATSR